MAGCLRSPRPRNTATWQRGRALIVQRLALAGGHRLSTAAAPSVPAPRRLSPGTTPLGALAFVAGLILLAVAWAVSLHVRPPAGRLGRLFTG